jgi:uncharacterized spore protein YtfJ
VTDDERQPAEDPSVVGEPLETDEGVRVPAQQNVGAGVEEGGGEWPDPNTPPKLPAPGAADDAVDDAGHDELPPGIRPR